ncbi:MAG TPA: hypothetical protein VNB49_04290 [Candidatus Dormibacteraeota bacterium]|nr:hypothetical protein [Candidatus Dormibacteraeota bacterium]
MTIEPTAAQNLNDLIIPPADKVPAERMRIEKGTWLQVSILGNKLGKRVSRSSILEGRLSLPVYSGAEIAIPADTKLRLAVDSVAKINDGAGKWQKLGRGILRAFNPLNNRPAPEYIVHTSVVEAILPDGSFLSLKTHVLRLANRIRIQPETRGRGKEDQSQLSEGPRTPGEA